MKKIIYIVLAVIAIGTYSCQKDNTAPAKKGNAGLNSSTLLKSKKDTTPPDFLKRTVKDTTPPDFTRNTVKRDTTPPDFK